MFLNVITHIKNSLIVSFKYLLFNEMFKMSSAAAQKAGTKSFQIFSTFAVVDPTKPNPPKTEKSRPNPTQTNPTQPMGQPNPWTTLIATNDYCISTTFTAAFHRLGSIKKYTQKNIHTNATEQSVSAAATGCRTQTKGQSDLAKAAHRMTPAHTVRHVTDRQTNTANIGNNSLHLLQRQDQLG